MNVSSTSVGAIALVMGQFPGKWNAQRIIILSPRPPVTAQNSLGTSRLPASRTPTTDKEWVGANQVRNKMGMVCVIRIFPIHSSQHEHESIHGRILEYVYGCAYLCAQASSSSLLGSTLLHTLSV